MTCKWVLLSWFYKWQYARSGCSLRGLTSAVALGHRNASQWVRNLFAFAKSPMSIRIHIVSLEGFLFFLKEDSTLCDNAIQQGFLQEKQKKCEYPHIHTVSTVICNLTCFWVHTYGYANEKLNFESYFIFINFNLNVNVTKTRWLPY